MRSVRLKLRNRILLAIIPITAALLVGISLYHYNVMKGSLVDRYNETKQITESRLIELLTTIDAGYRMLEVRLDDELGEKAKALKALYEKSDGKISQEALEALKTTYGNQFDFMVINNQETIVLATVPQAINFNFNTFDPELGKKIKSIRMGKDIWFEQLRTNVGTGKLSKFTYIPTDDQANLLEVGYSVDGFTAVIDDLKPNTIIANMLKTSKLIKDIKIYDAYGYQLVDSGQNFEPTDASRKLVARAKQEGHFSVELPSNVEKRYLYVELNSKRSKTLANTDKVIEITYNNSIFIQQLNELLTTTIVGILMVLLFLVVTIVFFSNRLTKPLVALRGISEQIGQGNYNIKAEVSSTDELGALGESFNVMVDEIQRNFLEIENQKAILEDYNKNLEDKVIQRTQELAFRNEELQLKNKELEQAWIQANEATESKSRFLAMISHEIRTPINGVIGMTYLLLRSQLNDRQSDYAQKIKLSAEGLLEIINDVLDISKLEAGKATLEHIDFNLEEMMELVSNQVGFKASEKNLELVIAVDADVPTIVNGDPLRIRQVLTNLTNNAVKFTEKGDVFVRVQTVKTDEEAIRLRFSVKDTGIGISEEQLGRLFEAFQQADESITRKYGGTGLGLSICKHFVDLMQGDISVKSKLGEGSEFAFEIDLKAVAQGMVPSRDAAVAFQSKRLLVVDDSEMIQEVLLEMLKNDFASIDCVANGEAAVERVKHAAETNHLYDYILMDWKMPKQDGIETAYIIKNLKGITRIPTILMLTGFDLDEAKRNHKSKAVDAFLSKPILKSALMQTLLQLMPIEVDHSKDQHVFRMLDVKDAISVLIVDDNPINQQIVGELLEHPLVHSDYVGNGALAVAAFKEKAYDLVIMDLQMPEMDGFEATRMIRKLETGIDVPIIAMTAHTIENEQERCREAGMNDCLTKPINDEVLFESIKKWVNKPIEIVLQQQDYILEEAEWAKAFKAIRTRIPISNLHGDWHKYLGLLKDFTRQYGNGQSQLMHFIRQKEFDKGKELLHAVRGIAGNLGAMDLFIVSQSLENDFAKGSVTSMSENFLSFSDELKRVLAEIENALMVIKPLEKESSELEALRNVEMKHFIDELKIQLANGSSESLMYLPLLRMRFKEHLGSETIQQIVKCIENYDFDDALQLIASHEALFMFEDESRG